MKKLLLLITISALYINAEAQVCEWAYTAGQMQRTEPVAVKEDQSGFHYVASFTDTGTISVISQMARYDVNQQLQWQKQISGDAKITDLEINAQNHAVVVGFFTGSITIDGNVLTAVSKDGFIFETDENGVIQWVHSFNPSTSDFMPVDLFIASDGNMYLTSHMNTGPQGWCAFHKLDAAGFVVKNEFNSNFEIRTFSHILVDSIGNVYLSGTCGNLASFDSLTANPNFPYQNFLVMYDSSFTAHWIMTREYITFDDNNKLCTDGQNLFWAFNEATSNADSIKVLKVSKAGVLNFEFVGPMGMAFFPSVDFSIDRYGNSVLLIAAFTRNYIYRYDASFNLLWNDTIWIGLTSFPSYTNLICYDSSFYIAAKYMHDTMMVDNFQLLNPNWNQNYPSDFFVARWHTDPVVTSVQQLNKYDVYIYPNPASDRLNISSGNSKSLFAIYDMKGRLWKESQYAGNSIDVSDLENGIYFLQMINDGRTSSARFTVLH